MILYNLIKRTSDLLNYFQGYMNIYLRSNAKSRTTNVLMRSGDLASEVWPNCRSLFNRGMDQLGFKMRLWRKLLSILFHTPPPTLYSNIAGVNTHNTHAFMLMSNFMMLRSDEESRNCCQGFLTAVSSCHRTIPSKLIGLRNTYLKYFVLPWNRARYQNPMLHLNERIFK